VAQGLEEAVIAYLDTHVAVWLHAGLVEKLSKEAKRQIEANDLLLSPTALLEFQYLYERKRISVEAVSLYAYLNATFGISLCGFPFPAVAVSALSNTWTSDPFDRLIVAQAQANAGATLLTADSDIRKHYAGAVW
jgi:PIN domain nuclease of toxin-antitoxin system